MTGRHRVPLEGERDPAERAAREAAARRAVRSQRVESRGLAACVICGGAVEDVDDASLLCDCEERSAEVRARIDRIVHERRRERDGDRSDRIAP